MAGLLLGDLLVCMGGKGIKNGASTVVVMDDVEVLNLATGETTTGPKLPSAARAGCSAFDSSTGYVYYVAGIDGVQ